jgi:hypothetical protein
LIGGIAATLFPELPQRPEIGVLFSPDYGGIPSLILKLFLVSVKLQPILSSALFLTP